jgi:hypothetical protein
VSVTWETGTPTQVFSEGYDAYYQAVFSAVFSLCQFYAPQIEAWMKSEAVWMDRTGNARQSLYAFAEALSDELVEISFDHGVFYGLFLEFSHQGKYAIIGRALDKFGNEFFESLKALLA